MKPTMAGTRSINTERKYVHQLPYSIVQTLSNILDVGAYWTELGGKHLNLNFSKVAELKHGYKMRGESPTEEVLKLLGAKNQTINDLFFTLYKMDHHQAMSVLKPFVDSKYHHLINEEDNVSKVVRGFNQFASFSDNDERESQDTVLTNLPTSSERNSGGDNRRETTSSSAANCPDSNRSANAQDAVDDSVIKFSFEDILEASENFNKDNELGRGAFGTVFKGTLRQNLVAIKRIKKTINPGRTNFEDAKVHQSFQELKALNRYRHENILVLHGYSQHEDCLCLIYQFMINGSLEDRLQCKTGTEPLNWWQRANIARGTACGLHYLHTIGPKPMIHGDIKSANILLDSRLEPKIGDFGLAREGPHSDLSYTMVSDLRGTEPYLPPEYMRNHQLSTKLDTYSFGVVLFEIVTGKRAYHNNGGKKRLLVELVKECSDMDSLRDVKAGLDFMPVFSALMERGVSCTHRIKKERPDMQTIHHHLEQLMEKLKVEHHGDAICSEIPSTANVSNPRDAASGLSKSNRSGYDTPPPSYQHVVNDWQNEENVNQEMDSNVQGGPEVELECTGNRSSAAAPVSNDEVEALPSYIPDLSIFNKSASKLANISPENV